MKRDIVGLICIALVIGVLGYIVADQRDITSTPPCTADRLYSEYQLGVELALSAALHQEIQHLKGNHPRYPHEMDIDKIRRDADSMYFYLRRP